MRKKQFFFLQIITWCCSCKHKGFFLSRKQRFRVKQRIGKVWHAFFLQQLFAQIGFDFLRHRTHIRMFVASTIDIRRTNKQFVGLRAATPVRACTTQQHTLTCAPITNFTRCSYISSIKTMNRRASFFSWTVIRGTPSIKIVSKLLSNKKKLKYVNYQIQLCQCNKLCGSQWFSAKLIKSEKCQSFRTTINSQKSISTKMEN